MQAARVFGLAAAALGVVCLALALIGPAPSVLEQAPAGGAAGKAKAASGGSSPPSFRQSWGSWLKGVEDQVEAAADVSRGLAQDKLAKLEGVLRGDLTADVKDEPQLPAAARRMAASTPAKAVARVATAETAARGVKEVQGGAASKPLAKALTRDDKFIARAREGVQRAEKALAMQEERGVEAAKATPVAAPHKNAATERPAAPVPPEAVPGKAARAAAVRHQEHRAAAAAAKATPASAGKAPAAPRRAGGGGKRAKEGGMSAREEKMLSVAMQGALEAGLQDAKAGKEESREVKQEESGWSADLSKWGLK